MTADVAAMNFVINREGKSLYYGDLLYRFIVPVVVVFNNKVNNS